MPILPPQIKRATVTMEVEMMDGTTTIIQYHDLGFRPALGHEISVGVETLTAEEDDWPFRRTVPATEPKQLTLTIKADLRPTGDDGRTHTVTVKQPEPDPA